MKKVMEQGFPCAARVLGGIVLFGLGAAVHTDEPVMEEITVTGQKQEFVLERQVRMAEDAVYALYNELNTDNTYDIHCRWEQPLGTHFRYRICRPEFLDRATTARGADFYANVTGSGLFNTTSVEIEYARHLPILKQKLQEVVDKSPELASAMRHHLALQEQLEQNRKDRSGRND